MLRSLRPILALALCTLPLFAQDDERFGALRWRDVGPDRGGRSCAVTGVPSLADTYYFGGAGGGVWKTEDAGASWSNVSDGTFGGSVGSVAVSTWDPNVVYAGMGEKTVRGNVSHGDGVWRSADAGRTWEHAGLADSRHVCRLRVHPKDADTVYAAALGHLYGPNEQRGVFRTRDGGQSWERVLFVSDEVGCVDLCMDPSNPRTLYASMWRIQRTPYSLESGGPGCGIWKTTDGGDTWTELTANPGMPAGPLGISGISVSQSDPDNVYAVIEAAAGGVFRSRDGGATWRRVNDERKLRQRAWYYTRCYADPLDSDVVYVLNVRFWKSKDGGETYESISVPHGDNHDLWIAPDDPARMIQANDGGANVTNDGGRTWSRQDTQPTAQMYRVSTDNSFPYKLLGGQQDNSTVRIPSRSDRGGRPGLRDWSSTAGGESGHVVAHPLHPDIVYGGSYDGYLTRMNHTTGERRSVHVWPDNPMGWGAAELKYRFQWNFPIFFSPHAPHALYVAANVLFKSTDEGQSWQQISPDLTRDDKNKQGPSGGPITKDNTSVEYYSTIFAALESPHEEGVLWCGSDDGLVHVSRDAGETWTDVTPIDLPKWGMVNSVEPHPTNPGGLYLAATSYKLDDFRPYLFKTSDYGATWERIDTGIPRAHFTRALRADPERTGLLYAGTERGVYVSLDDGASWESLQNNLPIVPITDLAVKDGDLIAATQGRGFWILDDVTPLHVYAALPAGAPFALYPSRAASRARGYGARITWNVGELPEGAKTKLEILESDGDLVATFSPTSKPGLNRYTWNLGYPDSEDFEGMILWNGSLAGPRAVPGTYTARITVGEWSAEAPFEVGPDPRSTASTADLAVQHDFLAETGAKLTEAHQAIEAMRAARAALGSVATRLDDSESHTALSETIDELSGRITAIEEALYQTRNQSRQDPLNFPIRLTDKYAGLRSSVATGDWRPTDQAWEVRAELERQIDAQLDAWRALQEQDLPAFNQAVQDAAVPAIKLAPPAPKRGDELVDGR